MTASPLWRAAAAAWALAILVTGVLPTEDTVDLVSDGHATAFTTLSHFAVYAVLGFVLGVALGGWDADPRRLLYALALSAALGAAIEVIQGPLPYRDAQPVDFLVDVAGAAAGLVVLRIVAAERRSRSRRG